MSVLYVTLRESGASIGPINEVSSALVAGIRGWTPPARLGTCGWRFSQVGPVRTIDVSVG